MRKRIIVLFAFCFVILSGCFNDPIQDELLQYLNSDLTTAHKLEKKAVSAYEGVTGANFTNDQVLYETLKNEVIPNYEKFLDELNSVKIENTELKEIHDIYLEGAKLQYEAFTIIIKALETQDPVLITKANEKLKKGRKLIEDYVNKLEQLAKDHKVTIDKNET
ncbi:hypothetical protein [Bacillus sp. T3]|uniref:hypothetical protein n=1 Tax=Bacillus sp. T3 TaxID=467262 RepID=UPI0029814D31|nr:hypothetical protein [Bacillus sp. T3]